MYIPVKSTQVSTSTPKKPLEESGPSNQALTRGTVNFIFDLDKVTLGQIKTYLQQPNQGWDLYPIIITE